MYTYSISYHLLSGDDGITAQLLRLLKSYLFVRVLRQKHYTTDYTFYQHLFIKMIQSSDYAIDRNALYKTLNQLILCLTIIFQCVILFISYPDSIRWL